MPFFNFICPSAFSKLDVQLKQMVILTDNSMNQWDTVGVGITDDLTIRTYIMK